MTFRDYLDQLLDALAAEPPRPACGHQAAIARIRALHRKASHGGDCVHCVGFGPAYDNTWPCQTIRALDEPAKD